MFIGCYNYTVIMTYLGVVSAMIGMFASSEGNFKMAIICLMVSGACDMVDGPIARSCKKRDEIAKKFGVQIDSLCDCIAFGVQPGVLVFFLVRQSTESRAAHIITFALCCLFALAAVTRLAYFNVTEEERQQNEGDKKRTYYEGLPVTNASIIIPFFYMAAYVIKGVTLAYFMLAVLTITGILFVTNFKVRKLSLKQLTPVIIVGILLIVGVACL